MSKPKHFTEIGCRALRAHPLLYLRALKGLEPAETLPTILRHRLVAELHHVGLSDVEIAAGTYMTTYTASRIRKDLRLAPNRPRTAKELSA